MAESEEEKGKRKEEIIGYKHTEVDGRKGEENERKVGRVREGRRGRKKKREKREKEK